MNTINEGINNLDIINERKDNIINHNPLELKIVPVDGYDGRYWISNYGNVFSFDGKIYKELAPNISGKSPYKAVKLYNGGKCKRIEIHRLVNMYFNPNPRKLNVTDHKDGNIYNNMANNLRWVTQKENINNPNSKRIRGVARFTKEGKFIDSKPSITSYCEEFGYGITNIWACLNGKTKTAYGYKWEYLNKDGYLPY